MDYENDVYVENDETKYKIFVGIILFFLLVFGFFVGLSVSYNSSVSNNLSSYTPDEMSEDITTKFNSSVSENIGNDADNNALEPVSTKKYDIELVYIDNYILCGKSAESSNTIYSTTLDELKNNEKINQLKENKEYEIIEESNEKLVYKRNLNQNCPEHFFIVLEGKKLNVYNVLTNEVKEFFKTIDISEELIRYELVEELTKGITVNSEEELNLIIEDIES